MTARQYSTHVGSTSHSVSFQDILTGMQPAFCNIRTGEAHLAQSEPGIPSSVYCFVGLPEDWIVERDYEGNPVALHPDVIAGYWRDAQFITLSQLKTLRLDS